MEQVTITREVAYTERIPICPFCQRPTRRRGGFRNTTPTYNEGGLEIHCYKWFCLKCKRGYVIKGDDANGFEYGLEDE